MYLFKTQSGNIQTLLIDGYQIGDLVLENVFIGIKFNKKGNVYAFITNSDKEKLRNTDYEHFIIEAQIKALEAINSKDFSFFYNAPNIIDIIDSNNRSYYKKTNKYNPLFTNTFNVIYKPNISIY